MHNLIKSKSEIPRYFAGIFYMINPFVYVRFMAGHFLILLAYSVFPFAVKSLMKFIEDTNKKQTIRTCLWVTLIAILNIHTLFLLLFLFLIFFIFKFIRSIGRKALLKQTIMLGLFFLLLNFYWILPLATAKSTAISQITSDDLAAFQTRKGNFNEFMHTLMMYGFWREDAYILPISLIPTPIYFTVFAIILFLSIYGYLNCDEKYKTPILITGILAQLLAVGISHPWSKPIFTFLFNHIYFIRGFREPQKFVALLVFAYAFFAAYGVQAILGQIKRKKLKIVASVLILALPFAYTPTMFNSFWNQIHTTDYPKDWYGVNNYLNQDAKDFNVLFLPWHLYMDFKWIPNKDKRIANPAESFFDKNTIKGDNMEVGNIYSSSNNPRSKYIEGMLKEKNFARLKLLNVKYIILAKEADYRKYDYIFNQSLKLIKETDNLYLLENTQNVSKFYQSDDLKELEPLGYRKISEIKYQINKPGRKYVIFTDTYNQYWQLGNKQPLESSPVNIYEYNGNNVLEYKRFRTYLAGYLISLASLIWILYAIFW